MGTLSIPCASRRQRRRGEGERASVPCGTLALFLLSGFTRLCAGVERFFAGLRSLLRAKREPEKHQRFRRAGSDGLRLPASASLPLASCWPLPQQLLPVSAAGGGRRRCKKGAARPFQTPKEKSKHKNASRFAKRIFCTSPVYGSADGVTLQQDFTFCKGVKSAAKQQMGETRKKCNSDDRRLRRIQGGAIGAAVSRTRVPLKARSGRWAPQPVLAQRLAFSVSTSTLELLRTSSP